MKNDRPTVSFTNEDFSVVETSGGNHFVANLQLSSVAPNNVLFAFEFTDGTARKGIDYNEANLSVGFLGISKGQTTLLSPLRVPINYNSSYVGNKTFTLTVKHFSGSPYTVNFPSEYTETVNGEQRYSRTITIVDREAPEIEITTNATNGTIAEDVAGGNLVVNYRILNFGTTTLATATQPVSFDYSLTDDTTSTGSDYIENDNQTETIQIGASSGSFTISITNDNENEGNESFILEFSNIVNGSIFTDHTISRSVDITIVDDELPILSISNSPLTVLENVGAGGLVVEVMLSGSTDDQDDSTDGDVTFNYTLRDGSATVGTDYTLPNSRSFTIDEGDTSATFMIPILDDTDNPLSEGSETFDIIIDITKGARFVNGNIIKTETITIHDNELPTLSFPTAEIVGQESNNPAVPSEIVVFVDLSVTHHQDVTFNYNMIDITATKNVDYLEDTNREVTIPAGESRGRFTVSVIDDDRKEGNESFTLTLSVPTNAVFPDGEQTISKTVTIEDNEIPTLKIITNDFTVNENVGSPGFAFVFALSGATEEVVSFVYNLTDVTAVKGVDYIEAREAARTIRFPVGDTMRTINIPITNDLLNEGDETFTFSLSNISGAALASGDSEYSTTITINDDEVPTLSISTTTFIVFEDIGNFVVEFELSGPTNNDVTFKYGLGGGTATKGTDYTEADNRDLRIPSGQTTTMISIPIAKDSMAEGNETFNLTLSDLSTSAVFARGDRFSKTITIVDVANISLAITTTDFIVLENIGGERFLKFEFELSDSVNLDVTFEYDLINGTAIKNLDYVEPINRTVRIPAGDTTGSFFISITDDLDLTGSFNVYGSAF